MKVRELMIGDWVHSSFMGVSKIVSIDYEDNHNTMKLRIKDIKPKGTPLVALQQRTAWYMPWETVATFLPENGTTLHKALGRHVEKHYGRQTWIRLQLWIIKHYHA